MLGSIMIMGVCILASMKGKALAFTNHKHSIIMSKTVKSHTTTHHLHNLIFSCYNRFAQLINNLSIFISYALEPEISFQIKIKVIKNMITNDNIIFVLFANA